MNLDLTLETLPLPPSSFLAQKTDLQSQSFTFPEVNCYRCHES